MGIDRLVDKDARQGGEMVGILGRVIVAGAAAAAMSLYLGMALQVVGKAVGNDGTLLDDVHALGHVFVDLVDEQWVMGATQDYGVYLWTFA